MLSVVRIKPLGAGGGGGESSACGMSAPTIHVSEAGVTVQAPYGSKTWSYPAHVMDQGTDNAKLYEKFMPQRVDAFLNGINVNVIAYGQTGSGKTHTVFGPPGIMERAGRGEYHTGVHQDYGLCPRVLFDVFGRLQSMRTSNPGTGYVLTASAVELSLSGNVDLLTKVPHPGFEAKTPWVGAESGGVALNKVSDPPRLYGMTELVISSAAEILQVFAGVACRNTQATGLNDSSSRSHCFVALTLHALDKTANSIRKSRLQFCDLAGSERLKDAHGGKTDTMDMWQGLMTNYSLTMLSQCARALVAAQKKGKRTISFKAYLNDLVSLLEGTMTGDAATAIFVCLSQAPANATHSNFALEFGDVFSQIRTRPRHTAPVPESKVLGEARNELEAASAQLTKSGGKGSDRYTTIRKAQVRDAKQILAVLALLRGQGDS